GFFSATIGRKLLFFVPMALSGLCLWVIPLRRHWWLLYPFTVLYLLPSWLVEPRYYLVSLSLFLLVREHATQPGAGAQLALSFGLALFFFVVSERRWLFLEDGEVTSHMYPPVRFPVVALVVVAWDERSRVHPVPKGGLCVRPTHGAGSLECLRRALTGVSGSQRTAARTRDLGSARQDGAGYSARAVRGA